MTRRFLLSLGVLVVVAAFGFGGFFFFRRASVQAYVKAREARAVMSDYVDNAVLRTLALLSVDAENLRAASKALQAQPNAGNLESVVRAWRAAHKTWMQTVAYRYGPAAQYDYHKRIATWPVDKVLVEHSLALLEAGRLKVDARYLREEQTAGQRGLYAMQYLLFRDGKPRDAASFRPAELAYLGSVAEALLVDSLDFEASWRGTENLAASKAAVLKAAGVASGPSFAEEFRNPGTPGNRYASVSVSVQEVFQEIGGAIEDLTPQLHKLRESDTAKTPAYWTSIDPCADLLSQLQGIEDAYLGGIKGSRGRSVSELVADQDRALDRLVKIALAHAAQRLELLRGALGKPPEERDLAIRVAQGELDKLAARLAAASPMVILAPAMRPYAAYVK